MLTPPQPTASTTVRSGAWPSIGTAIPKPAASTRQATTSISRMPGCSCTPSVPYTTAPPTDMPQPSPKKSRAMLRFKP